MVLKRGAASPRSSCASRHSAARKPRRTRRDRSACGRLLYLEMWKQGAMATSRSSRPRCRRRCPRPSTRPSRRSSGRSARTTSSSSTPRQARAPSSPSRTTSRASALARREGRSRRGARAEEKHSPGAQLDASATSRPRRARPPGLGRERRRRAGGATVEKWCPNRAFKGEVARLEVEGTQAGATSRSKVVARLEAELEAQSQGTHELGRARAAEAAERKAQHAEARVLAEYNGGLTAVDTAGLREKLAHVEPSATHAARRRAPARPRGAAAQADALLQRRRFADDELEGCASARGSSRPR